MPPLLLMLARVYAPLGARGALIDGLRTSESTASADRRSLSDDRTCARLPAQSQRSLAVTACAMPCDCASLAV